VRCNYTRASKLLLKEGKKRKPPGSTHRLRALQWSRDTGLLCCCYRYFLLLASSRRKLCCIMLFCLSGLWPLCRQARVRLQWRAQIPQILLRLPPPQPLRHHRHTKIPTLSLGFCITSSKLRYHASFLFASCFPLMPVCQTKPARSPSGERSLMFA
jgi:hypothetical protein